jgi:hypothetical protein
MCSENPFALFGGKDSKADDKKKKKSNNNYKYGECRKISTGCRYDPNTLIITLIGRNRNVLVRATPMAFFISRE